MFRKLAIAALAFAFTACMTVGEDFAVGQGVADRDRQDHEEGRAPHVRRAVADRARGRRSSTWTYGYYKYNLLGASQTRDLVDPLRPEGRRALVQLQLDLPGGRAVASAGSRARS